MMPLPPFFFFFVALRPVIWICGGTISKGWPELFRTEYAITVSLLHWRMSPIDVSICLSSHFVHLGTFTFCCCLNSSSRVEGGSNVEPASTFMISCAGILPGAVGIVGVSKPEEIRKLRADRYSI